MKVKAIHGGNIQPSGNEARALAVCRARDRCRRRTTRQENLDGLPRSQSRRLRATQADAQGQAAGVGATRGRRPARRSRRLSGRRRTVAGPRRRSTRTTRRPRTAQDQAQASKPFRMRLRAEDSFYRRADPTRTPTTRRTPSRLRRLRDGTVPAPAPRARSAAMILDIVCPIARFAECAASAFFMRRRTTCAR